MREIHEDVTAPLWYQRRRSLIVPEHWITYRFALSLFVPHFRYALLQEGRGEPTDYAHFFHWLERTPSFPEQAHVFKALATRHCGEGVSRADLQLWACPLIRWGEVQPDPCAVHPLGVFELPSI